MLYKLDSIALSDSEYYNLICLFNNDIYKLFFRIVNDFYTDTLKKLGCKL